MLATLARLANRAYCRIGRNSHWLLAGRQTDCVVKWDASLHMSGHLPHARPNAQRELMRYLQAAFEAGALERRPCQWKVRRNGVQFRFAGLTAAVSVYFANHGEIDVAVSWRGHCWDLLYSDGAPIQAAADGFVDAWSLPEHLQVYPNRRDLRQAETFVPFVQWCQARLMPGRYIYLYRYGHSTAALLDIDPADQGADGYVEQIELWPSMK